MPLCDYRLRSAVGKEVAGRYVDLFLLVDSARDALGGSKRVLAGCAEAARTGAELVTLGGFSSIVGERSGVDLQSEFGVPFTTGNTLTAAVLAEQAMGVAGDPGEARITVVGAGGDVGSGICRILHARGYRPLLVGRDRRVLEAVAAELAGTEALSWDDAAPRSDVVILVASAARGAVPLDRVSPATWVLDAGHPANAFRAGRRRYAVAGRVQHAHAPESDLPAVLDHQCWPAETHACLAEGEVLAFEGRWESYSMGRGRITPDRADEILGIAVRHGVTPAPLHFDPGADA
jgi:predicted amino acid dehydrogenase